MRTAYQDIEAGMLRELSFLSAGSLDAEAMQELIQIISNQIALYSNAQRPQIAESIGLSLLDYSALELIIGFGQLTTGQIARLTGLSSGGTTTLLNRLENAGYVQRARHHLDRRVIIVRPIMERCEAVMQLSQRNVHDAVKKTICHYYSHIHPTHQFLKHCLEHMRRQTHGWLDSEPGPLASPTTDPTL